LQAAQGAFEDAGMPMNSSIYDVQTRIPLYILKLPVYHGDIAEIIHEKSHEEKPFAAPPALSTTFRTEAPAHYSRSGSDTESDSDSESSDGFEWLD